MKSLSLIYFIVCVVAFVSFFLGFISPLLKKREERIGMKYLRYLFVIGLLVFIFISQQEREVMALKEVEHKTHTAFDGESFNNKEEAVYYEKIMEKVDVLMKGFQDEIGNLKRQKLEAQNKGFFLLGYDPYRIEGYDDYRKLLFECIKKLDEQGYEIEIKVNKKGE